MAVSLGFANLIADGIAMALGDYLSSKAEFDVRSLAAILCDPWPTPSRPPFQFAVMEMRREQWEYDNHFEGANAVGRGTRALSI